MIDPALIMAGATLFLLYTGMVLGGAAWLNSQMQKMETRIVTNFDAKHKSNETTVKALHELVIRHDVILDPEFSKFSNGRAHGQS